MTAANQADRSQTLALLRQQPRKARGVRRGPAVSRSLRTAAFLARLAQEGLPLPAQEFRFYAPRLWRADFCWPNERLILEVQGGIFVNGRHSRGAALLREWDKLNTAAGLGFRVIYTQPADLLSVATIVFIRAALKPDSGTNFFRK